VDWWDGKAKRGDGCQVPGAGDQERAKKRVTGVGKDKRQWKSANVQRCKSGKVGAPLRWAIHLFHFLG
jgi:hypothetical protein